MSCDIEKNVFLHLDENLLFIIINLISQMIYQLYFVMLKGGKENISECLLRYYILEVLI